MITFSKLGQLGRMGNQMFQISAVIGYARHQNSDYVIPTWEYARHFNGPFEMSDVIKPLPIYKEKNYSFDRIPNFKNVDLYGYFQSKKYWEHCEDEIRSKFRPNEDIKKILHSFNVENEILKSGSTCAIHVRRTDYLQLQQYHASQPIEYYTKAIDAIKADHYLVFSDDIDWCKENIKGENMNYIKTGNDVLDWFIMANCDHFIIANSSFSWWASFMGDHPNKRVIAPERNRWFGGSYNIHKVNDLYLPNWELL